MQSLTFHFCYSIISLQIDVETIIIWLVVGGVAVIEDKLGDVVVLEKMCVPIIDLAVMAFKEEDLWINLYIFTFPTEETDCLYPDIPAHIY